MNWREHRTKGREAKWHTLLLVRDDKDPNLRSSCADRRGRDAFQRENGVESAELTHWLETHTGVG